LASFSANPDRPRCPKCRRNTFRCWSGGERQNSAIRLHARRPGSQRRAPCPLPPSPQTRKEHRQERVCALWPPWGVTDGIEPGPASAQLNGQGEFGRLLRSPPIPAELSANYARTQWNLPPLWRGFSFSENSLGRRPQKSPPAIGAAAALFQSESTVSPLVRFSRQCILSLRLLLSKDRPKRSRRG